MRIYLASPWFCDSQDEREERVKKKLRDLGFDVLSPKERSNVTGLILESDFRERTFKDNLSSIKDCDIIFGITDGKQCINNEPDQKGRPQQAIDAGTIFECGYGYALGKKVVYYAETLGDAPFNLMLQESADVVITEFEDLDNLSSYLETGKKHTGATE